MTSCSTFESLVRSTRGFPSVSSAGLVLLRFVGEEQGGGDVFDRRLMVSSDRSLVLVAISSRRGKIGVYYRSDSTVE